MSAEFQSAGVGCFDFRGCNAFGGHQHRTEGDLHIQLVLGPLRGLWEGAEQLEPLGEVRDRFRVGIAPQGSLGCLL